MLVLSRKRRETVEVDGGVTVGGLTVTVVEIRGDKVRLGFEAPRDKVILRGDIADRIRQRIRDRESEKVRQQREGEVQV